MAKYKHIDRICIIFTLIALLFTFLLMDYAYNSTEKGKTMGYEQRLFSSDKVHTIDIVIDDWDSFIDKALMEEYSLCSVVIDGDAIRNVGIRCKGNTSLSNVASLGSQRYSFKIEFDQYDIGKTYYGLDKLCLNNIIQDNTYMKDYISYKAMSSFGVCAPLCSYAYVTVNGEAFGLYLAVEAIEESFLERNYGASYGNLYKPDSMDIGGKSGADKNEKNRENINRENVGGLNQENVGGLNRENGNFIKEDKPSGKLPSDLQKTPEDFTPPADFQRMPDVFKPPADTKDSSTSSMGRMGQSDVKLQYTDDDFESYSNIFDNAKTEITKSDKLRLVSSLKKLSSQEDLEEVVNISQVLRYFVVHNYLVNGDSYTGSMVHNYYLYEEDGLLSMIPWDYNLAFGAFNGNNAENAVNSDIDEVLTDRPMQSWIFSNSEYSDNYYQLYEEFINTFDAQTLIDETYQMISPYVEKDPTAFCTYDEFTLGVSTLKEFCSLRVESIKNQLEGNDTKVEVGNIQISDMGQMGVGKEVYKL